jgi:WD40 repeat protein
VHRKDGRNPILRIQLDSFESESGSHEGEVTTASFSPDSVMLAVARSDDELHLYDSRFMGRSGEPMARYLHWEDDCCVGEKWGVVDAVWVDGWCGRGFGIVTGGSDGEAHTLYTTSSTQLILLSKVACVSGTRAGQARICRMVRCLHGRMLILAISLLATPAAERGRLLCK